MKRMLRIMIYVILISLIPVGVFYVVPAEVHYFVTEQYSFTTHAKDKNIFLAVMLPKNNPYQEIENLSIKWEGDISRENFAEIDVIKLESQSGSADNQVASLTYDVILKQSAISWEAPVQEKDLQPQTDIESAAPILVHQAQELCLGDPEKVAYETYKFTSAYLTWPVGTRTGTGQSALAAYESKIGVCGEFANLMTALNRACENPARSISGLSLPLFLPPMLTQESTWMHPGGAHAWVEVYNQDHWTIADPSWASNFPFAQVWFGRSQGQYLSYGETGTHAEIFEGLMAMGEAQGAIIGAMSAPVKFVASSEDPDHTTITPSVSVKKVSDVRWILAVLFYAVMIISVVLVENRFRKKVKTNHVG
jgi:hypothetical protein